MVQKSETVFATQAKKEPLISTALYGIDI